MRSPARRGDPAAVEALEPRALLFSASLEADPTTLWSPASGIDTAVAGDFDADGDPDIAAVSGRTLAFLANNGDGTFAAPVTQPLALGIDHLAAGRMDGNASDDLVAATSVRAPRFGPAEFPNATGLRVLSFDRALGRFVVGATTTIKGTSTALAVGHLLAGPREEIVLNHDNRARVLSLPDRTRFQDHGVVLAASDTITPATFVDFEGDARPEPVFGTRNGVIAVRNRADGGLGGAVTLIDAPGFTFSSVLAADVDDRPGLELVVAGQDTPRNAPPTLAVWATTPGGVGVRDPRTALGSVSTPQTTLLIAGAGDINGDGRADIVLERREQSFLSPYDWTVRRDALYQTDAGWSARTVSVFGYDPETAPGAAPPTSRFTIAAELHAGRLSVIDLDDDVGVRRSTRNNKAPSLAGFSSKPLGAGTPGGVALTIEADDPDLVRDGSLTLRVIIDADGSGSLTRGDLVIGGSTGSTDGRWSLGVTIPAQFIAAGRAELLVQIIDDAGAIVARAYTVAVA